MVADLDTAFLHDARPQRQMTALRVHPDRGAGSPRRVADPVATLLAILAHPNVASNEDIIRRYDHEILGATAVRPLVGVAADAPADGVVIADHAATEGFAVGIGVNPWYGLHDPEAMAIAVVDEAIRNIVAVGADPTRVALLDNFSWGDPRRESTLGELVAAVDGCCEAAAMYGAPFVSGKDSLNNEYVGHDGQRHAVPPTLVITAVAHVPDADRCVTPDLHDAGNVLFQVGTTRDEFAGSHLDMVNGQPVRPGRAPSPDPDAPGRYRLLHAAIRGGLVRSCHDISEGGLAVAIAEMCIGGRLGAAVDTLFDRDPVVVLFSESIGRFVVEVAPDDADRFTRAMGGDAARIGVVTDDGVLRLGPDGQLGVVAIAALVEAYTGRALS